MDSRDLAFSNKGWAYDTGRQGRAKNLVIRIRTDVGPGNSKAAKETLKIQDQTGAGQEWSQEELQIDNAAPSQLAVVVGELLPEGFGNPDEFTGLKGLEVFDARKQTVLQTMPNSGIVVKRLGHKRCNLHLLHDKKDGLCRISPFSKDCDGRLVYYCEWTEGVVDRCAAIRGDKYADNVRDFSIRWLKEKRGITAGPAKEQRSVNQGCGKCDCFIERGLEMYQRTGKESYRQAVDDYKHDVAEMKALEQGGRQANKRGLEEGEGEVDDAGDCKVPRLV